MSAAKTWAVMAMLMLTLTMMTKLKMILLEILMMLMLSTMTWTLMAILRLSLILTVIMAMQLKILKMNEDENYRDEAQSFINKEKVLKIFLAPSECFMTQFEHTFRLFLREFYYAHYCKMFSTLPSVYNQRADVCPLLISQF